MTFIRERWTLFAFICFSQVLCLLEKQSTYHAYHMGIISFSSACWNFLYLLHNNFHPFSDFIKFSLFICIYYISNINNYIVTKIVLHWGDISIEEIIKHSRYKPLEKNVFRFYTYTEGSRLSWDKCRSLFMILEW